MLNRRDFLQLGAAGGGAVFLSALSGCAGAPGMAAGNSEFYFVQLSDTHWGYQGPANPESAHALEKAVRAVNELPQPPDFIMFTGDLTHTTDDPAERRRRLNEFKSIIGDLKVRALRFMPGEHDAGLDQGAAFMEVFGPTHYSFDHQGVHFMVIDNVSLAGLRVGEAQLQWLANDLAGRDPLAPLVVFTHRPLFDLAPEWDWYTRDGRQVLDQLAPFAHVTVFYGHIHQENHYRTGTIAHHSAHSLMFPLPAPRSQAKPTPVRWNPDRPFVGLGWREVQVSASATAPGLPAIAEKPLGAA